ncbi:MAG: sn-glycerol-1-phosphate dehydrogenase [Oscillibacter sp.]|jgi:glycerol-1-phosphate dehydrogenase [NAD(P)+]|nr:sn-glycerol-1-phosphate dehydrogenase [Oscillibacter sp.]
MEMYSQPHPLNDYLDRVFTCSCGREHYASLKFVSVRKDALDDLPVFAGKLGFQSLYLISDSITYNIAGKRCMEILEKAHIKAHILQLTHTDFDEATVGEVLIGMPDDCDLVVAVGTGAINDMTRYFSYRMGRPFFTVATAAPMDGFASSLAVLNINHLKTSIEAQTPTAIIGDTEILKNAPYRMIAAGLGDLLGKSTCLCDWKLSRIINGEHYCERIVDLVESCVQGVLKSADKARDRDPEVLGNIMEGLVLTGVAMSLYGNSRPASGCEHHMSHYWEMMFEQAGKRPVPHGTQVSVGTVLVLKLVEALRSVQVDFDAARAAARAYDPAVWEKDIRTAYGPAAQGVIDMEAKAQKNETSARLARIDAMEAHWDELTALLDSLPSSQTVIELLKSLDSPYLPAQIDVDAAMLRNTFRYCKEVRARYTILQMVWDLGLLDTLSDQVIDQITALS